MKSKKAKGIADRIKSYMNEVSVDVFGYEKKVEENMDRYLGLLSRDLGIAKEQLNIRIFKFRCGLEVRVYQFNRPLRQVTVKELIDFFSGEKVSDFFQLEKKVTDQVLEYFKEYSTRKGLEENNLSIRIFKPLHKIQVRAYHLDKSIEPIKVKELIHYFT